MPGGRQFAIRVLTDGQPLAVGVGVGEADGSLRVVFSAGPSIQAPLLPSPPSFSLARSAGGPATAFWRGVRFSRIRHETACHLLSFNIGFRRGLARMIRGNSRGIAGFPAQGVASAAVAGLLWSWHGSCIPYIKRLRLRLSIERARTEGVLYDMRHLSPGSPRSPARAGDFLVTTYPEVNGSCQNDSA